MRVSQPQLDGHVKNNGTQPDNQVISIAVGTLRMASYKLAKSFAPPTRNLRDARAIDDHNQDSKSQVSVTHQDPYDVTERQLDHYFDV